ncbi:MAG: transcriptional regulator [Nocardioides sp.]|uniref:transcriptional regulator n=1 Tax=Nocardioides sp. TaxID=35761 RepID=UPI0039E27CED
MQIEQVRRYVLSSLVCSVVLLHSLAMAALGATGADKGGARQGLFVISVLLGVLAIGAVRLINRRSLLTPWLAGALVIPLIAYYLLLWR